MDGFVCRFYLYFSPFLGNALNRYKSVSKRQREKGRRGRDGSAREKETLCVRRVYKLILLFPIVQENHKKRRK